MAEDKAAKKEIKKYAPPKECPKCGSRMANHADRYTCGRCSYTEFKSQGPHQDGGKPAQEDKKAQKQRQQGKKEKAATV